MVDVVVVLAVVALVIRGWRRGLLREAVGLAVLVVGAVLAFRLSTPVGHVIGAVAGTSPEVSRLIGGFVVFLGVSLAGALIARVARGGLRMLPGLPTVDRVAGAALGGGAGLLVATLLLSLLTVLPLPAAIAEPVSESTVAGALTDPDGVAQRILDVASGDGVMGVVLRIDELVDGPHVGDPGDEVVMLPVTADDRPERHPGQTAALRTLVNRERVAGEVAPLARGEALDRVARQYAQRIYTTGRMAHIDGEGAGPSDRLDRAGIPRVAATELIGLGASAEAVVDAWVGDPASRRDLLRPDVRRFGVAVLDGPSGLLMVMVATG